MLLLIFKQNLGLHCEENEGCLDMSMYSPYWMINKTGMTLYYTVKIVNLYIRP